MPAWTVQSRHQQRAVVTCRILLDANRRTCSRSSLVRGYCFCDRPYRARVISCETVIEIVGNPRHAKTTTCDGVEMFRSCWTPVQAWLTTSVSLLRGIYREGVERGQVSCKQKVVQPHNQVRGELYPEQGRRRSGHTPFFANYARSSTSRTTT